MLTDGDQMNEVLEILRYLIYQRRVQVNTTGGGDLHSALHCACLRSAPEIIEFLLSEGAEVHPGDSAGRTPAHLVCYRGLTHYRSLDPSDDALIARDGTHRTALHYAVVSADVALVRHVLDAHKRHPEHRDTYKQLVDAALGGKTRRR
ncbi:hypothetical protein BO71DRAFT_435309 [Aspergillus ellipticus CBS 707.79]|uniref:Uncharacterized protein n=1 Tax=Aspergillus ellipticus CBS 707.79 TaxID=1448320 RepID=A0A319CW57_9EURO|nr:hypothetical protein BO71DRAFT_435309 [Aspergillus ellipticus CBS 707.79]